MSNNGSNVMFGHSSRLGYDQCYNNDRVSESVGPMLYRLNPNQIHNCNACLSVFGPRTGHNGYGNSTPVGNAIAPAQELTDVESMLQGRNVLQSKCKDGKLNNIDISKYKVQHARTCDHFLDPIASRLTNPPQTYREVATNRFYDLPKNPQANIFWNFAENTQLQAKDNHREKIPKLIDNDPALPKELRGKNKPCKYNCYANCSKNCSCKFSN